MRMILMLILACGCAAASAAEPGAGPAWAGRWTAAPAAAAALPAGVDGIHLRDGRVGVEQRGRAGLHRVDDVTLLVDWADRQEWENLVVRRRGGTLYVAWWHIEIPYARADAAVAPRGDGELDAYDEIHPEDVLGLWRPALDAEPFERMARRVPPHIGAEAARRFHEQRQLRRWPGGIDLEFAGDGAVVEVRWSAAAWSAAPDGGWRLAGVHDFAGGPDPVLRREADGGLRLALGASAIRLDPQPEPPPRPGVEERIAHALRVMGAPGCIVAVTDHPAAGRRRYGAADAASGRAPADADRWWLASVGKLVVGRLTLELAAEGRLDLDDRVGERWSAWAGDPAATIAHLLQHRSGLANPIASAAFQARIVADPGRWWPADEPLAFACAQPPRAAPGTAFHYSNAGSDALMRVCEAVSGRGFEELARERLLAPAGCAATGFGPRPEPHPAGYRHAAPRNPIAYGAVFLDVTGSNPSWAGPAATMWSTVGDLERLLPALCDGAGLPDALVRRQRGWIDTGRDGSAYGLHLARIGGALVGHAGDVPGGSALLVRDQRSGAGIIVLCNLSNAPDGRNPATEIGRLVAEGLAGPR